jgi:hypothetical protein
MNQSSKKSGPHSFGGAAEFENRLGRKAKTFFLCVITTRKALIFVNGAALIHTK